MLHAVMRLCREQKKGMLNADDGSAPDTVQRTCALQLCSTVKRCSNRGQCETAANRVDSRSMISGQLPRPGIPMLDSMHCSITCHSSQKCLKLSFCSFTAGNNSHQCIRHLRTRCMRPMPKGVRLSQACNNSQLVVWHITAAIMMHKLN